MCSDRGGKLLDLLYCCNITKVVKSVQRRFSGTAAPIIPEAICTGLDSSSELGLFAALCRPPCKCVAPACPNEFFPLAGAF